MRGCDAGFTALEEPARYHFLTWEWCCSRQPRCREGDEPPSCVLKPFWLEYELPRAPGYKLFLKNQTKKK